MRSTLTRHKSARMAAVAVSMALLAAACTPRVGNTPGTNPSGTGTGGPSGATLTPGTLLISDGSPNVRIGDATVTFPGNVTDAAWSPDGSRIAYIDGTGNVATAKPDGTDVLVLTQTAPSITRSRPTWSRSWIYYAEKEGGSSTLMFVPANGCANVPYALPASGKQWPMDTGPGTSYVDLAPSASTSSTERVAFQHNEPGGPEIWVDDSNQRGHPPVYKVVNGSNPALTLDGTKLAYVGRDGYIHATTDIARNTTVADMTLSTTKVDGASHLVWSPDGSRLAYETSTDVEEIAVTAGAAKPPAVLSNKPGVPSYLDGVPNILSVITGADPVALSVAASRAGRAGSSAAYTQAGPPGATITTTPDATSDNGQNLRLITAPDKLDDRVAQELKRLYGNVTNFAPGLEISPDISSSVESQLHAMGFVVVERGSTGGAPQPLSGVCGPQGSSDMFDQRVVVVDANDPVAVSLTGNITGTVIYLHGGALTQDQTDFLHHSSGILESAYALGNVPVDVAKQVAGLISGPLGYSTVDNPVLPSP
jgi:hypothetical protein